ncbi:ATPase [Epibacterium ulvae]|uniref:ATP12 family chaperone protein n=1 Tax=Epibacterium ulvae TaxID=1156985 RepID=UPI001BFCA7B7|nr:ATP12 family protein [Epibacterium ulvae]MBT8155952.1 ATPase [Epibacterium ulvae]
MSEWKQKRFWKAATSAPEGAGFTVLLDGRKVKTPAKAALVLPTEAMALAVAAEWDAQEEVVNPNTMPCTRSANAAIDKVSIQHGEVADMLAEYGDSDLLCYRAESPAELVTRQGEAWDPALEWATQTLGASLACRNGILHAGQDPVALKVLRNKTHAMTPFQLAAFHDLVSLSGSLVLGFAAALDWRPAADIWALSRLDEKWQEEQWGTDEEASAVSTRKEGEFQHAKRFFDLSI